MTYGIGDRVDDFSFTSPDGSEITLRSFQGKPLVLIFLRHLA